MAYMLLFRDKDGKGGYIEVIGDIEDLDITGFNDAASSVGVFSGTFTLYSEAGFKGDSVTVSKFGGENSSGYYPNPGYLGGRDNLPSSVKLNSEEPTEPPPSDLAKALARIHDLRAH